jgi:hypothetical protein
MTATAIDVHCDDVVAAMARIADGEKQRHRL